MIEKYLMDMLVCPRCKGALTQENEKLLCGTCPSSYEIDDGIPVLLPEATYRDIGEILPAWNEQWSKTKEPDPSHLESEPDIISAYEHVKKYHSMYPSDNFLEAGCGSGRLLYLMGKSGVKVIGMDLSVGALKLTRAWLKKAGIKEAYFLCADMRYMPVKESSIGMIYGGGSIEHFEETQLGINELRRVLRPGGVLTLTYPVISLATLTYRQLFGNIPELPVLKQFYKFMHVNILKKRFMRFGLEKSFLIPTMENYFKKAGFDKKSIKSAYFETYLDMTFFKSESVKNFMRKLAKNPLFWPMVFTNGVK
jgi:ubiquinone/menaquinone biosynthesis C-methylase UbiE/uncharacterized protein YbaR (Trm112 family)